MCCHLSRCYNDIFIEREEKRPDNSSGLVCCYFNLKIFLTLVKLHKNRDKNSTYSLCVFA